MKKMRLKASANASVDLSVSRQSHVELRVYSCREPISQQE